MHVPACKAQARLCRPGGGAGPSHHATQPRPYLPFACRAPQVWLRRPGRGVLATCRLCTHPHPCSLPPLECRFGYASLADVAGVAGNHSAAGLPLEALWTDADLRECRLSAFSFRVIASWRFAGLFVGTPASLRGPASTCVSGACAWQSSQPPHGFVLALLGCACGGADRPHHTRALRHWPLALPSLQPRALRSRGSSRPSPPTRVRGAACPNHCNHSRWPLSHAPSPLARSRGLHALHLRSRTLPARPAGRLGAQPDSERAALGARGHPRWVPASLSLMGAGWAASAGRSRR